MNSILYLKETTELSKSGKVDIVDRFYQWSLIFMCLFCLGFIFNRQQQNVRNFALASPIPLLSKAATKQENYEVFGFAPYWNLGKCDNIDFRTLTTLAFFGIPVDGAGNLVREDIFEIYRSRQATELFKRAHASGTKVVLTLTQMDNDSIESLVDNPQAQENLISQAVAEVKDRGIDGVNIDFEYVGDPGQQYRYRFSTFIKNLTDRMHQEVPDSKVTVSVYASAVKEPKIYDISSLGKSADGIFMMAYDFAVSSADQAMPTSPLYGHQNGKYWYDISTAVSDFLTQMPREKLILGLPWYGYNYLVYRPEVKADTLPYYSRWVKPVPQTYSDVQRLVNQAHNNGNLIEGWDDDGKVGWKAYYENNAYSWRMVFIEDTKSLGIKYDFAKENKLGGIGIWALGFEDNNQELWQQLAEKFGLKLADENVIRKEINDTI